LTPKHIDVAELLAITQCRPLPVPILPAIILAAGVEIFAPAVDDFALLHVLLEAPLNGGQASMNCDGPAIVICTDGEVVLTGDQSSLRLRRGDYCFITPDEGVITLEGFGEIFGARKGLSPVIAQQMSV
jgi:mannose-6-phosphate isomerase